MDGEYFDSNRIIAHLSEDGKEVITATFQHQLNNNGGSMPLEQLTRAPHFLLMNVVLESVTRLQAIDLVQYGAKTSTWQGNDTFIEDDGSISLSIKGQATARDLERLSRKEAASRMHKVVRFWYKAKYRFLPSPKVLLGAVVGAIVGALITKWISQ